MERVYFITIQDNKTQEMKTIEFKSEYDLEFVEFYFEEGNMSCDCNLGGYFGLELKCSSKNRIDVIKVEEATQLLGVDKISSL